MNFNFLILGLLFLLYGCTKEPDVVTPDSGVIELETLGVAVANTEQVLLEGRILKLNNEKILQYGFKVEPAYGNTEPPTATTYLIRDKIAPGKVTTKITDKALLTKQGGYYTAQFFIKTADTIYTGNKVNFAISDLVVDYHRGLMATIGETITVAGKFDQIDPSSFELYAGWDNPKKVDFSIAPDRSKLTFVMPWGFSHGQEVTFSLRRTAPEGHVNSISIATVKVLGRLLPPENYSYYFSDVLELSGLGVPNGYADDLWIIIGDKKVRYFPRLVISDLLYDASGTSFQLGYSNGRDIHIFPQKLQLKQPDADEFSFWRTHVHPRGNTTAGGLELGKYGNFLQASLGGKPARFFNYWNGTISVAIGDVEDGTYPLVVNGHTISYTSKSTIKVEKLKIHSVSPKQAYYADPVTLSGNFIDGDSYFVKVGGQYVYPLPASNGQLRFDLPSMEENAPIEVGYSASDGGEVIVQSGLSIKGLPGTFDDFTPKSGPPGTIVTLKGRGFGGGRIFFGDQNIYPFEYSSTQVKVEIPRLTTKGKKRLSVFYKTGWISAPSYFEVE